MNKYYCETENKSTCLTNILNKNFETVLCNKTKERKKFIERINDGAILIAGKHRINNKTLEGTYLVTFKDKIKIDDIEYINIKETIKNYVRAINVNNLKISKYIEAQNDELKFENIDLLNNEFSITESIFIWIILFIVIILMIFTYIKLKILYVGYKMKKNDKLFVKYNNKIDKLKKEIELTDL